jgi:hypothetical protein
LAENIAKARIKVKYLLRMLKDSHSTPFIPQSWGKEEAGDTPGPPAGEFLQYKGWEIYHFNDKIPEDLSAFLGGALPVGYARNRELVGV